MTISKEKENKLVKVLKQNRVVFAALFGSRARGTAIAKSDYDVLVEFEPSTTVPLSRFIRVKDDVEKSVDRNVDIVTVHGLGQKHFRREVLSTMKVLYDQRQR